MVHFGIQKPKQIFLGKKLVKNRIIKHSHHQYDLIAIFWIGKVK